MKRFIVSFGLALGLLAMAGSTAMAAEFMAPSKGEGNVTVSSTETHHNLYVAGGNVLVNGPTTGDLYTAGGEITVEAPVEQDITVAGGNIHINGPVGGDVRAAGGTVVINSAVTGDVIIFGGTVEVSDRGSVGGDLVVNGGQINISGPVKGKLTVNGGNVTVNNSVAGDTMVRADQLTFGSQASVPNKITYKGASEAQISDGAQVGNIEYTKTATRHGAARKIAAIFTIGFVIKLIAGIVFALLALYLFPKTSRKALNHFANRPGLNFLIGLIGLIFIPIVTIIVMVIILGLFVGLVMLFAYVLLLILAMFVATVYTGAWIGQKLAKKEAISYDWQAVVIGVVAFGVLRLIPIVGWIAALVLMMIAFGALLRSVYDYQQRDQAA